MDIVAELQDVVYGDLFFPIVNVVVVSLHRLKPHRPQSLNNFRGGCSFAIKLDSQVSLQVQITLALFSLSHLFVACWIYFSSLSHMKEMK